MNTAELYRKSQVYPYDEAQQIYVRDEDSGDVHEVIGAFVVTSSDDLNMPNGVYLTKSSLTLEEGRIINSANSNFEG